MSASDGPLNHQTVGDDEVSDAFSLGRRLRHLRKQRGFTLSEVTQATGITSSQLSLIENGKREPKLSVVQRLAACYQVTVAELTAAAPNRRTELEIELDRAMRSPLAQAKGLRPVRISPRMSMDVLESLVQLHRELARTVVEQAATPEVARRANTELRAQMRAQNNYFPELERAAEELLAVCGYQRGPLLQHEIATVTKHLGFTLHHVSSLPHSTRSVTDLRNMRIYLLRSAGIHDPRSVLLQALGHYVLGHATPVSYADFLRQRIETNYFAAAMLVPQEAALEVLRDAKRRKELSIEDLRDHFGVSYETAAHRMTNLLTQHLQIPLHFQKVHESGIIHKAYENDGVQFPTDPTGAVEGQPVCRFWTSRQVFDVQDKFNAFDQYTDTPSGTYWCTARVESGRMGDYSTSIGVPYAQAKWFRGRDTQHRSISRCPDETCCRRPPADLAGLWSDAAWPTGRANTHLLAALPQGPFPGVDQTEVFTFLQSQSAL